MKKLLLALITLALFASAGFGLSRVGADRAIALMEASVEQQSGLDVIMRSGEVEFFPRPAIRTGPVTISREREILLRASSARIDVDLFRLLIGQADYSRLVLYDAEISIPEKQETALSEPNTLDDFVAGILGLEELQLHNARLQLGQRPQIIIKSARLRVDGSKTVHATATMNIKDLAVSMSGQLRKLDANADELQPWALRSEFSSPLFKLTLNGKLGASFTSFEGSTSLVSPSLRSFLSFAGYPLPEGPGFDVVQLETTATYVPDNILNLRNLKLKLDGNTADGALQMRMDRDKSALQGTLAFDLFDLSPYLVAGDESFSGFIEDLNGWRRAWDADLRLSANRLRMGRVEGSFAGALVIQEKTAELAIANTTLGTNQLYGRLAIVSAPDATPQYEININAQGLRSEALSGFLPRGLRLDGSMNTSIVARASGETFSQARASLNGEVTAEAMRLSISGISLTPLLENLSVGRGQIGWPIAQNAQTQLHDIMLQASISEGELQLSSFAARIADKNIQSVGVINLHDNTLSVTLDLLGDAIETYSTNRIAGQLIYPFFRPEPERAESLASKESEDQESGPANETQTQ